MSGRGDVLTVVKVLKARFPNLTVEEAITLANQILDALETV